MGTLDEETDSKPWYMSKTVQANAVAVIGLVASKKLGRPVDPDTAFCILALLNTVLRFVTNKAVRVFKKA